MGAHQNLKNKKILGVLADRHLLIRALADRSDSIHRTLLRDDTSTTDPNNDVCALLKFWVQDVPKTKSSKSRETDRTWDVGGIVRIAGEWRPVR